MKNQFILYTIIICSLTGTFMSVMSCKEKKPWKNPYEYKLDEFLKIDEELVCFKETGTIPLPLNSPHGIAVDPEGTIYVTGDEKLFSIGKDGIIMNRIELNNTAYSCAAFAPGIVYAGYTDYVEKINLVTKQRTEWASLGEKALITSIAVGSTYVFVANAGNRSVLCYNKEGRLVRRITGEKAGSSPHFIIPSPYFDVAAGPEDSFWVANPGRYRVEHWSAGGGFLGSWGSGGSKPEQFLGCCNPVHLTLLATSRPGSPGDTLIITAEKGIPRIKVFTHTGEFICMVALPEIFEAGIQGLDLAAYTGTGIASESKKTWIVYVLDPVKKLVRIFERKGENHEGA